jgi:hypothetical protein
MNISFEEHAHRCRHVLNSELKAMRMGPKLSRGQPFGLSSKAEPLIERRELEELVGFNYEAAVESFSGRLDGRRFKNATYPPRTVPKQCSNPIGSRVLLSVRLISLTK